MMQGIMDFIRRGCFSLLKQLIISLTVLLVTHLLKDYNWVAFFSLFITDLPDFLLYAMDRIPLSVGGSGASSSKQLEFDLNLPASEEDPGDPVEIEKALTKVELDKINEQKEKLAEEIRPIIEEQKARLCQRFSDRDLAELPEAKEMVEIIINRFAGESAKSANKPNAPRANFRFLKTWLTRAQQSAKGEGKGNMSVENQISSIIYDFFK